MMKMNSIANARELGGYTGLGGRTVRHGLLLRTAALARISEEDMTALRGMRLSLVVDFRDALEIQASPDPALEGVRNVWIPVSDFAADDSMKGIAGTAVVPAMPGDVSQMAEYFASPQMREGFLNFLRVSLDMGAMYQQLLGGEKGQAGFGRFFRLLLQQPRDEAVLWHCSAGKDRTGIAAALLLSVLGTDRQTVLDDYERTNEYMAQRIQKIRSGVAMLTDDPVLLRSSESLAGVQRAFMRDALDMLDARYGSPEGYVKDALGLTGADLTALREKYLEP